MQGTPEHDSDNRICENCGTTLAGQYCHACGQSSHNPLRNMKHAMEEVFESFWHLDGRVFRTLRDLLVPGRVIRSYLEGHRARYIAPLRLYLILSILTFFVAHFAAAGVQGIHINAGNDDISNAKTVADVIRVRDAEFAELDKNAAAARRDGNAVAVSGIEIGRTAVADSAARRIAELEGKPVSLGITATDPEVDLGAASTDRSWWGGVKRTWQRNAAANARQFTHDKGRFAEAMLTHVPTTLFVLVPVFALLLRLAYLLKPMGYLEHLVVALYSHAMLLLFALLVMLCMLATRAWSLPSSIMTAVGWFCGLGTVAWLLLTQKRVYGQGWAATVFVFLAIGSAYTVLATLALAAAVMMTFVAGSPA